VRKALRYILILIIVGVLIIAGGLGAIYLVPNTFAQDDGTQVLVIEKGQTGTEIADMLYERGLIRSTQGFKLWLYLSGTNDKLQTGHYQIPNKVTVRELISLLQEGHVESIRVTIYEGKGFLSRSKDLCTISIYERYKTCYISGRGLLIPKYL